MDTPISETARNAIEALSNDDDLSGIILAGLSNLTRTELELFRTRWPDIDDDRRIQALSRLVELAENNVEYNFDSIFRYALKDSNEDVRYLAIEGLWENEQTSLIDSFIELLESDESDRVQAAAAVALGKFAVMAELKKLRPQSAEKVIEALLGAVDDRNKSVEVTRRVIESAAPLNIPDVKEAIREAYESGNPDLKISAIYSMGKSCDLSWISVLLGELRNEEPEFRYEAATACGELEDEESVPALIELTHDSDIEVCLASIQALGKIGSLAAKKCIEYYLESSNQAVREAAEEAAGYFDASDDLMTHNS